MVGGLVDCEIIWNFFWDIFKKYEMVIFNEFGFVVLKGVVYLGYVLNIKESKV